MVAPLKSYKNSFWLYSMRFGSFLGCHQLPERSFFLKNKQFPICARCTGVFIGQITALVLFLLHIQIPLLLCIVFCLIMFCDWFIQRLKILHSTNSRRLITGIFGGYGYMTILCKSVVLIIYLFTKI